MTMPLTIARYEVLQRIGRGAMGSLYLARDPNLGRLIAIKIADLDPDGARRRFRREARAAGALGHPNIVAIFDYGEFNGAPFIVMEYIRGETLFELISRRATLALAQKLGLLEQLCRGLDYAHTAGIVHCDIKPGNLMIDQHGALKILDFGISRIAQVSLTPRGDLIGTPGYMSPEQIEERQIDGTSDLFAAGAVAYELLAYRAAFPGDSRREILHDIVHSAPTPILSLAPGIGAGVARIVERALEKSPAARYLVASSMQRDLQAAREALDREPASRLPSAELGTGSGLIQSEADDRELERERRAMAQRAATLAVNRGLQYLEERAWNAARRAAFEACALDPENAAATALHEAAEAGPKESTQVVQQYVVGGSHPLDRTATAGLVLDMESGCGTQVGPGSSGHSQVVPARRLEEIQFTLYRPKVARPLIWCPLLAFAHLADRRAEAPPDEPDPIEQVRALARQALGADASAYRDTSADARRGVPRDGEITLVPDVPGVEFNPARRTFRWVEDVHKEEFRFRAGADLDGTVARGRLTAYLGVILLAEVDLSLPVDSATPAAGPSEPTESISSRPYRRIFASYSHADVDIVRQFERYVETLGDSYLRDVRHLRAGEDWDDGLLRLIDQADVFQLFWSSNAMRSPYMRREWEYALSLNRPTFVRPTYWEVPLPESPADGLPPDALRRLHFQRIGASIEDQLAPSARQPDTADTADLLSKAMHSPTPKVPDRYEPQRRLGQGAMGSVHLFRDVESGRLVVIKYLDGDRDRTDVQIRFFHEARKRGALQHPNIGTILDDPVHGDSPFIVMEHIQGETLAEVIGRSAPLPIRQKLNILEQLCRGLSHLHRAGVIHRNINPWNLMVDEQGVLKIVGFGIACLSDSDVAEIAGTPSYMAPEQIAGGPVDRRSDLFAAGALAYELLTYRRAFSGASMGSVIDLILHSTPEPIRSVVPEIGADVVAIVTRALEKTPEARYQDAADMERDLQVAIGLRSGSPGVRGSGGQVMNHERPVHLS